MLVTPRVSHQYDYTIYYDNEVSFNQIIEEIFEQHLYAFQAKHSQPLILDAGSNIGLAALYFKRYYPDAHIICFEPDPVRFELLMRNIEVNCLKNIKPVNAALSGELVAQVTLYGQIKAENSDARGNSIYPEWGCQRENFDSISVDNVLLSTYLNRPVDLLKLDIEGAEQSVLTESASQLHWVKELIVEVHETLSLGQKNRVSDIEFLLATRGFNITATSIDTTSIFPTALDAWVAREQPALSIIRAQMRTKQDHAKIRDHETLMA